MTLCVTLKDISILKNTLKTGWGRYLKEGVLEVGSNTKEKITTEDGQTVTV